MNVIGIILLILGCVGLWLGNIMYGDIGITATFVGVVALVTGVGFVKIDHEKNKE